MSSANTPSFISASDFEEYNAEEHLRHRYEQKLETYIKEVTIFATRNDWNEWIKQNITGMFFQTSKRIGVVDCEDAGLIEFDYRGTRITVNITGNYDFVNCVYDKIVGNFEVVKCYIDWMYNSDGNYARIPLSQDRLPFDEMYPFLNGETLTDYYDRFVRSSSNILLLIGPPGTGKTSFIKGLLAHTEESALVTYDPSIMGKDYMFSQFIEGDTSFLVLEDSDNFLKGRDEGNDMMHRFLNVGDGLVTTRGKKLIFSTNLPSVRDIDPALIRPGRCFDIINFEPLNADEAVALAARAGVSDFVPETGKKYTIAEVFNGVNNNHTIKKANTTFGFM